MVERALYIEFLDSYQKKHLLDNWLMAPLFIQNVPSGYISQAPNSGLLQSSMNPPHFNSWQHDCQSVEQATLPNDTG